MIASPEPTQPVATPSAAVTPSAAADPCLTFTIRTGVELSPDGTRVAYSTSLRLDSPDPAGRFTVQDLATGRTVDRPCVASELGAPHQVEWSPTADRIALDCGVLTTFDASGAAEPVAATAIGDAWAFHWTDEHQLIVVDHAGDIRSLDVSSNTSTYLTSVDELRAQFVLRTGVFSPDGQWLAYLGSHQDGTFAGYVMRSSGGTPIRVLGDDDSFVAWSADSRALICTRDGSLDRVDVETLERSTIAPTADYPMGVRYREGAWRIP